MESKNVSIGTYSTQNTIASYIKLKVIVSLDKFCYLKLSILSFGPNLNNEYITLDDNIRSASDTDPIINDILIYQYLPLTSSNPYFKLRFFISRNAIVL
jgi:hypothetical protein